MYYRNYKLEVEKYYNEDYQEEGYRAIILDENGNVFERCDHFFVNETIALENAKDILDDILKDCAIQSLPKKMWISKSKTFLVFPICIVLVLLIGAIFPLREIGNQEMFGQGMIYYGFAVMVDLTIILPIGMFFTIINKEKINLNGTYIYDDGLYAVNLSNSKDLEFNFYSTIGANTLAATSKIQGEKENREYLHNIKGIKDILRLEEKQLVYQITKVMELHEVKKNKYRITVVCSNLVNYKEKIVEFTLSNHYDDFEDLLNCFKVLKEINDQENGKI